MPGRFCNSLRLVGRLINTYRLIKVSSVLFQWEAMVVLTETMAWEEGLEWVVAVEVVMAWEVLRPEGREVPALEVWRLDLETGSAWSVEM